MGASMQLEQRPPTRGRRPWGAWVVAAAVVAAVGTVGGVVLATGGPWSGGTPRPAATAPEGPAVSSTGVRPTEADAADRPAGAGADVTGVTGAPTGGTGGSAAGLWLWPFADATGVSRWQQAYRQGGQQPWHLDAGTTALGFAGYLGYANVDRVVRSTVDAPDAYVAVGFRSPDGVLRTAADVHLVRAGAGADAPWVVVGTRDSTLTLDLPGYGATATSPMTVGGRITGVDERVVVTLHAQAGSVRAAPAAVDAGGTRMPWSVRSRFDGAPGTVVTVAAATGGHVAAVERFAVTAVRTG
jgi:hypothetical protein